MVTLLSAVFDPKLCARVVSRRPLCYAAGPDADEDRPGHVRAGSGLAWLEGRIAVIQDDASFVALVDPTTGVVDAVALPRGEGSLRLFDDTRGNKRHKLDLEACVVAAVDGVETLVAFGSGSSPARERLAIVTAPRGAAPTSRLVDASALYAALRAEPAFCGSELNVEGAALLGERLRLLQRGNGAARGAVQPVNATAEVRWPDVLRAVVPPRLDGSAPPPITLSRVTQWDLGALDGVRVTFTDAALHPSRPETLGFLATAEDSPDAVRDGPVVGTVLGFMDDQGARQTRLLEAGGDPFREKAEGLLFDPTDPTRAWLVVDSDESERTSELCEVRVAGTG